MKFQRLNDSTVNSINHILKLNKDSISGRCIIIIDRKEQKTGIPYNKSQIKKELFCIQYFNIFSAFFSYFGFLIPASSRRERKAFFHEHDF